MAIFSFKACTSDDMPTAAAVVTAVADCAAASAAPWRGSLDLAIAALIAPIKSFCSNGLGINSKYSNGSGIFSTTSSLPPSR